MHEIYELKDKLCKELEKYGSKEMTTGSLEVVDKLAHTVKNLGKIIEMYEDDGYSGNYMYDGRDGGDYSRRDSYRGGSYARGRGRGARRDAMGRYSRDEEMMSQLRELMEDAPDETTKQEFKRFIQKIESM